jgi:GntR family transcriptional regulator / MocR family aminotransferase
VAVDDGGLRVEQLPRPGRREAGARLAVVTPSHQFPAGGVMPPERRSALLAWAGETGAFVVEDDYDSEFRYDGLPLGALQGMDREGRVIYAGTLLEGDVSGAAAGLRRGAAVDDAGDGRGEGGDGHGIGDVDASWRRPTSLRKATSSVT